MNFTKIIVKKKDIDRYRFLKPNLLSLRNDVFCDKRYNDHEKLVCKTCIQTYELRKLQKKKEVNKFSTCETLLDELQLCFADTSISREIRIIMIFF